MNRSIMLGILLILVLTLVVGCNKTSSPSVSDNDVQQTQKAREEVIDKFTNERDDAGTAKFVEDTYFKYPTDEVIAVIYNYSTALNLKSFNSTPKEMWLDEAKRCCSRIPTDYEGPLSDEIVPYITEFLGDDWQDIREDTLKKDEAYKKITVQERRDIYSYIQERVDNVDKKEGYGYGALDKILKEVASEYDISVYSAFSVWNP